MHQPSWSVCTDFYVCTPSREKHMFMWEWHTEMEKVICVQPRHRQTAASPSCRLNNKWGIPFFSQRLREDLVQVDYFFPLKLEVEEEEEEGRDWSGGNSRPTKSQISVSFRGVHIFEHFFYQSFPWQGMIQKDIFLHWMWWSARGGIIYWGGMDTNGTQDARARPCKQRTY